MDDHKFSDELNGNVDADCKKYIDSDEDDLEDSAGDSKVMLTDMCTHSFPDVFPHKFAR